MSAKGSNLENIKIMKEMLVNDEIDQLFEYVSRDLNLSSLILDDFTQLQARYERNQKSKNYGIISRDNYQLEYNNITYSILSCIRKMEIKADTNNEEIQLNNEEIEYFQKSIILESRALHAMPEKKNSKITFATLGLSLIEKGEEDNCSNCLIKFKKTNPLFENKDHLLWLCIPMIEITAVNSSNKVFYIENFELEFWNEKRIFFRGKNDKIDRGQKVSVTFFLESYMRYGMEFGVKRITLHSPTKVAINVPEKSLYTLNRYILVFFDLDFFNRNWKNINSEKNISLLK